MVQMLEVLTVLLVAVAMALALAHALELPGKLRLDRSTYLAVQTIYYPGFTYGGIGEGLSLVATLALLLLTPVGSVAWWWILTALIALVAMHGIYWGMTHPVNKYWLKEQELSGFGRGFFAISSRSVATDAAGDVSWMRARDRWEHSHVLRAVLAVFALICVTLAVAR